MIGRPALFASMMGSPKPSKVEGNNITFTVTIDFGGMPFSINYKGVVATEQIKLNADMFGQAFEMVLKKDAAKK